MIRIETAGDYVQLIYVDPVGESVQQELKSDTDAFECSYDSDGKLFMQFGAMRFENPDPTDFIIEGDPVTDAADFISKLNALFTGGGGGGVTIYTGDGSLSSNRAIDLNGKSFQLIQSSNTILNINSTADQISINSKGVTTGSAQLFIIGLDGEEGIGMLVQSSESGTASSINVYADSDNGYKFYLESNKGSGAVVEIEGNADENALEYTADTHTFNVPTVGGSFDIIDGGNNTFNFTAGTGMSLNVVDPIGDGNKSTFQFNVDDTKGHFIFNAYFNDDESRAYIEGTAQTGASEIEYEADTHTFNGAEIDLRASAGSGAFAEILLDAITSSITLTGVLNLPTQAAPSAPNDGDVWREDNTDTGLKIRINGFTKTIVVS